MIDRDVAPLARKLARKHAILTLTGPRQSGKTTLCKSAFPEKPYVTLEDDGTREFALADARSFLAQFPRGAILDEIQNAPQLFSQLQVVVDARSRPGDWILTGSQDFALAAGTSQSLAGRTALITLLAPSLGELQRFKRHPKALLDVLWSGAYPRIHEERLDPARWLADYVRTYVERDVRKLLNIGDLLAFQTFLKMCAGRAGQLLNFAGLAADCGIAQPTAKRWLSVLEASYIVFRLPPFHRNWSKRLVKAPKLHFYDSGLLCWLLAIRSAADLANHAQRGAVFESWVASEIVKQRYHAGLERDLSFYRDRKGLEVDLVLERGTNLDAIEVKSGQTAVGEWFGSLESFDGLVVQHGGKPGSVRRVAIYGGDERQQRERGLVLPWKSIADEDWG